LEENIASVIMVEEYAKQETSMKQACFLLGLLFEPEDGDTFLQNFG
jgi:hypothetical protein